MQTYRVILTIDGHTHKPKKVYKWHNCKSLKEAWEFAREVCAEYNKQHKWKCAITGVGKN
jgi:hypothetical protein